ncbi:MAG TPA: hypothetical protein VE398_22025 [Acidobacteriota bacterium]|nr:hypothetical protein [Acidobacteriota bacterium]
MEMLLACLLSLTLTSCAERGQTVNPPSGRVFNSSDLIPLLAKSLEEPVVRGLFLRLNQGQEPDAHVSGNALVGESRMYFFPSAGVIVCATDFSGEGQRIGNVTLVGKTRKVVLDGREYAVQAFRGSLPLALKWGESRADIHKRLGRPTMSNEGIGLSDRPKSPIQETRDADEFQEGDLIIRLIYTDPLEGASFLEEIHLQRITVGNGRKDVPRIRK